MNFRKILLFCMFFLCLSCFIGVNPSFLLAFDWDMGVVDSEESIYSDTSIVTDEHGNYLITYFSFEGDLKFAKSMNGGSTWIVGTVEFDPDDSVGINSSLAVDSSGNYLIAYYKAVTTPGFPFPKTTYYLAFAKSVDHGSTWDTSIADFTPGSGSFPSIAVDSYGNYLIASYNFGGSNLTFSKSIDGGDTWITSVADPAAGFVSDVSFTVDAFGNYLISYVDGFDLKFAVSTDGGDTWDLGVVDSCAPNTETSITTDADNNYLISYVYESETQVLGFAKSVNEGATWTTGVIDSGESVGRYSSLDVDFYEKYIVSYYDSNLDGANRDLKFAISADGGSSWMTTSVDTVGDVGLNTAITTDLSNSYLISYIDTGNEDLKFAKLITDSIAPDISLNPLLPDPTSDSQPVFTGVATDELGWISGVQYQIDGTGGTWEDCDPVDGAFDESSEEFTCTVSFVLSEGSHIIYIRATDNNGNTTTEGYEVTDEFIVDTSMLGHLSDTGGGIEIQVIFGGLFLTCMLILGRKRVAKHPIR